MFRFLLHPISLLFLIISAVAIARLDAASTLSYQGRLTDNTGQPLDGTFSMTFSIYSDALIPSSMWTETQNVTCTDGFFSVLLGAATAISPNVFVASTHFLGIKIGADPELTPRRRLSSALTAMRVQSLDGATGGNITGNLYVLDLGNSHTAMIGAGGRYGGNFAAYEVTVAAAGVRGTFNSPSTPIDGAGVEGQSVTGDGSGIGGRFTGGYFGASCETSIPNYSNKSHVGVYATAIGYAGSSTNGGVYGISSGAKYNYGVSGYAGNNGTPGAYSYGVYGSADFNDGSGAWAGYFNGWTTCNGTLEVTGTLVKPAGSFRIDHPLDPENKYLQHSFVESPDMKNIYDGNVVTDVNGDAVVTMPEYFSALNRDFRYQLTVIGQFAQAIISQEIRDRQFSIKTDKPNVKVSWQVTGIRQDAYANAHRIEVEVAKKPQEVGRYIDPVAFGKAPELQLYYEMNRAAEDQRKADEQRMKKNREAK